MLIVSIDSSTQNLVMALIGSGSVFAKGSVKGQMRHSENILPLFQRLMKMAGKKTQHLDQIAVGVVGRVFYGAACRACFCKRVGNDALYSNFTRV